MDKPAPKRVLIPLLEPMIAQIDDYRFANRLPSQAEAIRQLIRAGLEAKANSAAKAPGPALLKKGRP